MSDPLDVVAPAFVAVAHRIVWAPTATVDAAGHPRTRVLHPIWEWDGSALTGWIATSPLSPKADDLAACPVVSLTYWDATHDVATADCATSWDDTPDLRAEGWQRFVEGPPPAGYDPSLIPGWEGPESPGFGVLRLSPHRLRVMPGSVLLAGQGQLLTWSA